jgi:predicted chitinase
MPEKQKYRLGYAALRRLCRERPMPSEYWVRLARDLGYAMAKYGITERRVALIFLAQVAHESGLFKYTEEIASGVAYNGRLDLGNTQPGDGPRYKGRSFMQITGRANYRALPHWDGIDFEDKPWKLSEPKYAALAAAWWFRNAGLIQTSRSRVPGTFIRVTRRINGGINGLPHRVQLYARARKKENRDMLTPKRRQRPVL